ncbi:hypothetical protein PAXRUDRAFT_51817, partial [Paxillus rubicundulus Ve08.2h10]
LRLVLSKGMIKGVRLDQLHETMGQCKACNYAKATRKSIRKEQEPKHCEVFDVHTDLWGPSPGQ